MNKKRMSERKSELRLNIEDFCLSLPENSDPIVGYLLTILQWEASLDIETNSVLHKSFVNQIEELKCKLKLQLKSKKNRQEINSHNNSIAKYINEFHKLKQVFSYCLILSKKKSELCEQLQKYCEYKPTQINLTQELQNYLNEPIIFQTIFHSYLQAFNVNILTADLISFLYAQHQQKKHSFQDQYISNDKQHKKARRWSNSDIQLLKNKTITFKQLTNMNKKYLKLQKSLQNSYIHYLCHDFFDSGQSLTVGKNNNTLENLDSLDNQNRAKTQQEIILKQKVKKLERILIKIKNQPGLNVRQNKAPFDTDRNNVQKSVSIILQVEPLCNLSTLEMANDENETASRVIQANKQFFLSTLYGKSWCQVLIGDEQFTFMRDKIIKVQALFFLNRILAATNAIAYAYNQLDLEVRDNYQFQFKNLRKLIGSQFINRETYDIKQCDVAQKTAFYSSQVGTKAYSIVDCFNNKILYPSAINYFICFIRSMISTNFNGAAQRKEETNSKSNGKQDQVITEDGQANNDEGILQILQAKSQYMESLVETIVNIYEIIKVKQLSCYKILRQFSQIILKASCWNHLSKYSSLDALIGAVSRQKQKIGIISQIVYEFDHNYSIKDPLLQLIRIEFDGLTNNCLNTFDLYKSILCEIIQIRNGLKLDHFYSVNQIHENFSLIPSDIEKLDAKKNKHHDIYFQDIIHEICIASQTNLYLPKLFFFFDLQLKFKRIVFKLQLCWSSGSGSVGHSPYHDSGIVMFDKRAQAFKQFLNNFCAPIFEIVHECRSIVQILQKMQQIERYTEIFSQQVSRYHLIEKLVSIIGGYADCIKIPSLRQHVNKLTKQDLVQLHTALNIFNPIQSQKCSNRFSLMQALSKNVCTYNTIRVTELSMYNPTDTKLRQELASILFLLSMITVRNQGTHHEQIVHLYHQDKILSNIANKPPIDIAALLDVHLDICIDSKKMSKIKQYGDDLYLMKEINKMNQRYQLWTNAQNKQDLIKLSQQLLVLSTIQTLREMQQGGQNSQASQDYKNLTKFMNKFEIAQIFNSLSSIQEIQFWRNQLSIMTKYHQIYQLMFHFDQFNSKVYGKASKKVQYKQRKLLNQNDHKVDFNNERCDFITKIYYVFQVSQLTRQMLQKNIQKLQSELLQTESAHSKPTYYRTKLKGKLYAAFCEQVQKIITKSNLKDDINIKFTSKNQPSAYIDLLRKQMLKAVTQYKLDSKQEGFGNFVEVQMFIQKKGYELPIIGQKQNRQYKIVKKHVQRNKKPIISPHRLEQQKTKPLEDLKRKFKIDMLKQSIQLRKQISKLQLSQNKIREQITWETSKLEHEVVEKINEFITLSNVDQQQSYTNFKHTVNIETIKGIQNVIEQQTQMYMEKKNAAIQPINVLGKSDNSNNIRANQSNDGQAFITEVQQQEQHDDNGDRSKNLLDANIQSMLVHMKKIKIFWAWKKSMKKQDNTKKQWCNFNQNVQNILNNDKIVDSIMATEIARNNYLRQNVTCSIIREQNTRINQKIQELKISNLDRKVKGYRDKLLGNS